MSDLLARLGAVATGQGDLSVPRARARFEPVLVAGRLPLEEATEVTTETTSSPAPVALLGSARPGGGDGVGRQHAGGGEFADIDVPRGPTRESRSTPSPPPGLDVAPATSAAAPAADGAVSSGPSPVVPLGVDSPPAHSEGLDLPTPAATPEVVLAELLAWIDDAVERRLPEEAEAGAAGPPPVPADPPFGPEQAVLVSPQAVPGERADAPAGPVVTIGRVEVRVVPAPVAARPVAVRSEPEALRYAGPTLEEFLGGRR
jgi:hypothetical protein